MSGFLPGNDFDYSRLEKKEPNLTMLVPLLILGLLAVLMGVFPNFLTDSIRALVNTLV